MKSGRHLRFYASTLVMGVMLALQLSACGAGGSGTVTTPGGFTPNLVGGYSPPAVSGTYTVGGTITAVSGTVNAGLNVALNGFSTGALPAFTSIPYPYYFASPVLTNGSSYVVTVVSSPAGQPCTVSGGTGTISGANVTTANINC